MANELRGLAGQLNSVSGSLSKLGIDIEALHITAAAFQAIGGTGQIIAGVIAAKEMYNTARMAEGIAQLAKYGPYALVIGPIALGAGYLMGEYIERAISTDDNGGMRRLAEV